MHLFTQSHHGSSAADSYGGKAKQHLLKLAVNEGNTSYNYSSAYLNCKDVTPKADNKNADRLWAANSYFWGAMSNGRDSGKMLYDNIPKFQGKVSGVPGCRSKFAFRYVSACSVSTPHHTQHT
jgi:hypothetical protein